MGEKLRNIIDNDAIVDLFVDGEGFILIEAVAASILAAFLSDEATSSGGVAASILAAFLSDEATSSGSVVEFDDEVLIAAAVIIKFVFRGDGDSV